MKKILLLSIMFIIQINLFGQDNSLDSYKQNPKKVAISLIKDCSNISSIFYDKDDLRVDLFLDKVQAMECALLVVKNLKYQITQLPKFEKSFEYFVFLEKVEKEIIVQYSKLDN